MSASEVVVHVSELEMVAPVKANTSDSTLDIEAFFDGECPLCRREIAMLRRLDRRDRIRFTGIAAVDFDSTSLGRSLEQLMDEIHGRLPDGAFLTGVEVFRRLYAAVGFRRIVRLTRLPGISHALTIGYKLFAKNRLQLTGRCSAEGLSCPLTNTE